MNKFFSIICVIVLGAFTMAPAAAEVVKLKGGTAIKSRIGPWMVSQSTFEDGARVCFAHNFSSGSKRSSFSMLSIRGGPNNGDAYFQFAVDKTPKKTSFSNLTVAGTAFDLRNTDKNKLFYPRNGAANTDILDALSKAEKSKKRGYTIVDPFKRRHNFSAASTEKLIAFMKSNCGFKGF